MKMRKTGLLAVGGALLMLAGLPGRSMAGLNINIGINAPLPAVVIPAPPLMVVIPGTYVYYPPDVNVNVLFYHGYWYRPHEGRWYRARAYNGPWIYLSRPRVPRVLITLPPDYRRMPRGRERIPYGQLRRNWSRWERERYWDRREDRRDRGRDEDHGRGWGRHGRDDDD